MNLMANQFLDVVSLTEQPRSSVMNVANQEEIEPPQDTTMMIWHPDLIMRFDDLFESHQPLEKVSVVKTRSKGPPVSKDPPITQTSRSKTTPDRLKAPFTPCKEPISIHTQESPKLEYNVVEDLKNLKANISVMDICRIPQ